MFYYRLQGVIVCVLDMVRQNRLFIFIYHEDLLRIGIFFVIIVSLKSKLVDRFKERKFNCAITTVANNHHRLIHI